MTTNNNNYGIGSTHNFKKEIEETLRPAMERQTRGDMHDEPSQAAGIKQGIAAQPTHTPYSTYTPSPVPTATTIPPATPRPTATPTATPPPILYSVASTCSPAIESRIDGEFEGWDGETIFPLTNGQIWQQVQYAYTYSYKDRASVTIYSTVDGCTLKVEWG